VRYLLIGVAASLDGAEDFNWGMQLLQSVGMGGSGVARRR
jgi:hypothetical protein